MEDSDSEYEIEEAIVLVELKGIIDSNFLLQEQIPSKILGIDTEKPILQLGQYTFAGEYEDTLGTVVVYEPNDSQNGDETTEKKYKFLCKTDKKLSMKRVFIQEKAEVEPKKREISSKSTAIPTEYSKQELERAIPAKLKESSSALISKHILDEKVRNVTPVSLNKTNEEHENTYLSPNDKIDMSLGIQNADVNATTPQNTNLTLDKVNINADIPIESDITDMVTEIVKKTAVESIAPVIANGNEPIPTTSITHVQTTEEKNTKKRKFSHDDKNHHIDTPVKKIILENNKPTAESSQISDLSTSEEVPQNAHGLNKCSDGITSSMNNLTSEILVQSGTEMGNVIDNTDEIQVSSPLEMDLDESETVVDHSSYSMIESSHQLVESSTDKNDNFQPFKNEDTKNGCSSSADLKTIDVCQSSDTKNISESLVEQIETDFDASSSNMQNKSIVLTQSLSSNIENEDTIVAQSTSLSSNIENEDTIVAQSTSLSSNIQNVVAQSQNSCLETNIEISTCDEISQSSRDDSTTVLRPHLTITDFNNCEVDHPEVEHAEFFENESDSNRAENTHAENATNHENQQGEVHDTSNSRKLSSCEVTQSCSTKIESKDEDNVNECEVFLQNNFIGPDNVINASSSRLEPLPSADEGPTEVDFLRDSVTSEGSTSEISQSHKTKNFSADENVSSLEDENCDTDIGVCSQSSSHVPLTSVQSESKDLCVSSCDFSAEETGSNVTNGEVQNPTDVVSQSNKSQSDYCGDSVSRENDEMISGDVFALEAHAIEGELATMSNLNKDNFCEVTESYEPKISADSEDDFHAESNSSECEALIPTTEVHKSEDILLSAGEQCASSDCTNDDVPQTKIDVNVTCEVTQSSSAELISTASGDLNISSKLHSSECDVYEENYFSEESEVHTDDKESTHPDVLDIAEESGKPVCEVSQSFRSPKENNLPFEECCGSSDEGNEFVAHTFLKPKSGDKNSEVSQSVSLPGPSSNLQNFELNECDRIDLISHSSDLSKDPCTSVKEVCSSDEINTAAVAEINLDSEKHSINNTACEVTQSDRPGENISVSESHQKFEDDSLNECEAYGKSSLSEEQAITIDEGAERNICESSDDIDCESSENLSSASKHFSTDNRFSNDICQSSRLDENVSQLPELHSEVGSKSCGVTSEGEIDTNRNVSLPCQSSEDVKMNDNFSAKIICDPCTSSGKAEGNNEDDLSSYRACDSLSNQISNFSTDCAPIETDNSVSQSEKDPIDNQILIISSLAGPSLPNNSVTVSSSVDNASIPVGVIYSSRVLQCTSNSEVSQSSVKINQENKSNNIVESNESYSDFCLVDNSNNQSLLNTNTDSSVSSNTVERSETNSLCSDQIRTENPAAIIESSSNTVVESSSTSLLFRKENEGCSSNIISKERKNVKDIESEKKISRKMKFTPKIVTKSKEERSRFPMSKPSSSLSSQRDASGSSKDDAKLINKPPSSSVIRSSRESRPSLLEVIVSSASDFRNSLIHDNSSFEKEINKVSSPSEMAESSSNYVESCKESSERESFLNEARCSEGDSQYANAYRFKDNSSINEEDGLAEISESRKYGENNDNQNNRHQVSQSSEIASIYSSTRSSGILDNETVTESSQQELVQSSSGAIKISNISESNYSNCVIGYVSSAEELVSSIPKPVEYSEVSESSSASFTSSTFGNRDVSDSIQHIESSDDISTHLEDSTTDNLESEVTSTPFKSNDSNIDSYPLSVSNQCSVITETDENPAEQSQNLYQTSEISKNLEQGLDLSLNSTSENNVSASQDRQYSSKKWSVAIDKDNPCESSSVDGRNSSCDSFISESPFIISEASNEAEILKSSDMLSVDDNAARDETNSFSVSESNVDVCIPQVMTSEPVTLVIETLDDDSIENSSNPGSVCNVSQSVMLEQPFQYESFSGNSEVSFYVVDPTGEDQPYSEITINAEGTCISDSDAQINSVLPGNSMLENTSTGDNVSVYSQVGEFSGNITYHPSSIDSQLLIDEQVVTAPLESSDRPQSVTESVISESSVIIEGNISQSHLEEMYSESCLTLSEVSGSVSHSEMLNLSNNSRATVSQPISPDMETTTQTSEKDRDNHST